MHQANPYSTWLPIAVIAVVLLLRSRNVGRARPFNIRWFWVLPLVVVLGVGAGLATHPPAPLGWAALAAGLVLGLPLGWKRAKLTHIARDPETGALTIRQSAAAMLLLVGVIVLKQLANYEMREVGTAHAEWLALAGDALMGFALGSICMFRGEIYWRARAIMAG